MRHSTYRAIAVELLVAAIASMLFFASGCRREEVTHFRVKKAPDATAASVLPGVGRGELRAPQARDGRSALKWTLPQGWTDSAGSGMRYATLKPPVADVEVSVIVLPGPAGGELANVNRWRGQIGLGPIDEPALAAVRKSLKTKAGPISIYDFSSEGQNKSRLIAGLAAVDGNTWFVKMLGDADAVGAAQSDFTRILQSLRRDAAN
jgi:hypothetical protein